MGSDISENVLNEFFAECEELIEHFSSSLEQIEKKQVNTEILHSIYRDMHTIKGSAQLFGFKQIGQVAHAMEASLDPYRKLQTPIDDPLIDSLFESVDLIESILDSILSTGSEGDFKERLEKTISHLIQNSTLSINKEFPQFKDNSGVPENLQAHKNQERQTQIVNEQRLPKNLETSSCGEKSMENQAPIVEQGEKQEGQMNSSDPSNTVRVQVNVLDNLMNLVGELVLVRNQVLQYATKHDELEYTKLSQKLNLVTGDLQGEVMKTRMQPIGHILSKFQRVVRDLARDLGKQIELTLEGTETELDKTLLEAIKDPLTHIVRNSCDHGIELPEVRRKGNKPEKGHIQVRAFHEGGQVIIEISDDGQGLNLELILNKALEKGIITLERSKQMTEREIQDLIFAPGLSTTEKVTTVSGRGVGMDVVKTNVERIGGSVELQSVFKKGSTVRLKIPLTLAIVPAMVVRCAQDRFAIPQVKLVELVRADSRNQIEYLQGKPMFRLRGNLLPLVSLKEALGLAKIAFNNQTTQTNEDINIVVLNADGRQFGLVVDEIQDTTDIVVKPLSQFLKKLSVYSGASIMGDGSVALILDVTGLSQNLDIFKGSKVTRDQSEIKGSLDGDESKSSIDAQEYLLFRLNTSGKFAIPLCLVNRLEEFQSDLIEFSGEQRVIQYRGSILPLVSMNHFFKFNKDEVNKNKKDLVSIIVVQKKGRSFGIEVDEILDVVSVDSSIDDFVRDRPGILGNLIVNEEIIVAVDVLSVIDQTNLIATEDKKGQNTVASNLMQPQQTAEIINTTKDLKVLFVEDTAFFRKHVGKVLNQAGYKVTIAVDGQEALKLLESSSENEFDIILTDIEMPKMTGFQFAVEVRKQIKWNNIPLIALTTRFKQTDIDEGMRCGFNLYLEKLNQDQLLTGIEKLIKK